MDENIIKHKIEKAIFLICQLYKYGIITNAFITGSVARGTAKKESDIDINLINPLFIKTADIPPEIFIEKFLRKEEKEKFSSYLELSKILKDIGVEFKQMQIKDFVLWYQLYEGEIFHLMTAPSKDDVLQQENIEISKNFC